MKKSSRQKKHKLLIIALVLIVCAVAVTLLRKTADNTPVYSEISDLEGRRVAIVTGTTFDTLADKCWNDCEKVYFNSFNDLIPALTANKADCFISDAPWAKYLLSDNHDICIVGDKIRDENYGLVFAKNEHGRTLCDDFNAFLQELGQDTTEKMDETWCNTDASLHPKLDYEALPDINGTIRVGTEVTNPPFEFYEGNAIVGYNMELLYRFCESRGYGMTVEDAKFDSLIPGVNSGKYDIASSSFAITPERAEEVYFSDVVYVGGPVVLIRTENSADYQAAEKNVSFIDRLVSSFEKTFFRENRWLMFLDGIALTLIITAASLAAGTALGFGMYMWCRKGSRFSDRFTGFLSWLVTGMPEVLLLMIMFYIVFGSSSISGAWVSVISFTLIVGVNVFGMIKNGVSAIDNGQMEAALAIGYTEKRGFFRIILPQALEYIMPNYQAGVVSLIKSTAIVGYLAVQDLTKVSDIVRSRTYEAFFPLIATAAIYFLLARILIVIVNVLQKKLLPIRNNRKTILRGIKTEEGGRVK